MILFSIPYNIPSQNATSRRHWSLNAKDVDTCTWLVRAHSGRNPAPWGRRRLTLTSYRKQRFYDDANYRGGAKYLVDAIVRAQLLKDDSDKWAEIHYRQDVLSAIPPEHLAKHGRRPLVVIQIEDLPN